jgi:hypothetical protein
VFAGLVTAFGCLAIIGGIALADSQVKTWRARRGNHHWPVAPGVVMASGLEDARVGSSRGHEVRVRYEYQVGDAAHTSHTISFGPTRGSGTRTDETGETTPVFLAPGKAAALALVAQYPVGRAVSVRYNPASPAIACLEPHELGHFASVGSALILLVAGVGVALGGMIWLARGRRGGAAQPAAHCAPGETPSTAGRGRPREPAAVKGRADTGDAAPLAARGQECFDQQDWEQAQRIYQSLLLQRLAPAAGVTKADVYLKLGLIHARRGESLKAKNMYERGLEVDPSHAGLREALAALE